MDSSVIFKFTYKALHSLIECSAFCLNFSIYYHFKKIQKNPSKYILKKYIEFSSNLDYNDNKIFISI
ncbi:MAG: hypothetical protein APF77_01295 [Clostridia bacterium BRH_c25]|nr:MAG: hypothetical protein APF77_01295 [Clostridia bacterium BRH_c25]